MRGEKIEPKDKIELKAKRSKIEERIAILNEHLAALDKPEGDGEAVDLEAAAADAAAAEEAAKRQGGCSETTKVDVRRAHTVPSPANSTAPVQSLLTVACQLTLWVVQVAVSVLKNTISGVLTIYLYFMDLISDYQVTMLYYNAGAYRFAAVSAGLLIGQFTVVWLRVLPYLHLTYGSESAFCARAAVAASPLRAAVLPLHLRFSCTRASRATGVPPACI